MSLVEARQLIWDEIIFEMKKIWESMNLVAEQKLVVRSIEFFNLSSKNEDIKDAKTTENFMRCLNANSTNKLISMDISDKTKVVMKITKVI